MITAADLTGDRNPELVAVGDRSLSSGGIAVLTNTYGGVPGSVPFDATHIAYQLRDRDILTASIAKVVSATGADIIATDRGNQQRAGASWMAGYDSLHGHAVRILCWKRIYFDGRPGS